MISPLLDAEIIQGIRQLAIAGYSLMIIAPIPTAPSSFSTETEEIAYRIMILERSNILLALEKTATVIQWPLGMPFSALLARVRQTRPVALA